MSDEKEHPAPAGGVGASGRDAAPPDGLAALDRTKQYLAALVILLTTVAQFWNVVENQWKLAAITFSLTIIVAALYVLSHKVVVVPGVKPEVVRVAMICVLIATPLISLAGLYTYSYLPRLTEKVTTIAVARFVGPTLPKPYEDCRPSDMLVHTLSRVGARFGQLKVFELPYSIDPDNRWAETWAQAHGMFEAADVIVYGEYTEHNSDKHTSSDADELVINPEVEQVPSLPLLTTSAPLNSWTFRGSIANIRELCGSDLPDAGGSPSFLDDARRLALAVSGAQLLGQHDIGDAREALDEAKETRLDHPEQCEGTAPLSLCPGVLAFYLATLDARLGYYVSAEHEYTYAAEHLGGGAPYLNLGELYMRVGDPQQAFAQLNKAIEADPSSVATLATRATFERDYLLPRQATIDLDRALQLSSRKKLPSYDRFALSRALYQRGGKGDAECGIEELRRAYPWRPSANNVNTVVRYGDWLLSVGKYGDAVTHLQLAVGLDPNSVDANYHLALALERMKTPDLGVVAAYLRRAEYGPDSTDQDFLYKGNAAAELVQRLDGRPNGRATDRADDFSTAQRAYHMAIQLNPRAVYAYYGLGQLEAQSNPAQAEKDLKTAARMHPDDPFLQSVVEGFLKMRHRLRESSQYRAQAQRDLDSRIPPDEQANWFACGYGDMDTSP